MIWTGTVMMRVCMELTGMDFLRISNLFSSGRGFFLALSAAGRAGSPRVHYNGRTFGLKPGSVARALRVGSRARWLVFTGSLSAEPEPPRTMETPQFQQNIGSAAAVSHRPSGMEVRFRVPLLFHAFISYHVKYVCTFTHVRGGFCCCCLMLFVLFKTVRCFCPNCYVGRRWIRVGSWIDRFPPLVAISLSYTVYMIPGIRKCVRVKDIYVYIIR